MSEATAETVSRLISHRTHIHTRWGFLAYYFFKQILAFIFENLKTVNKSFFTSVFLRFSFPTIYMTINHFC